MKTHEDTSFDIEKESPFSPLSKDNPEDEKFIHELQTIVEEFCNNLEKNILVEEYDSSDDQFHSYIDETTLYDDSEFLQIRDYLDSEIQELQHSIPSSTFPGDDSPNQGKARPETPLFPKATITVGTSMLLMLSYSLRHGLSAVALTDLLLLISLHCPAPSFCTKTLALFRRFFRDLKIPVTLHQHCSKCLSHIETPKLPPICQKCNSALESKTSMSYFLELNIAKQLENLLNKPKLKDSITSYRFERGREGTRKRKDIGDIYDGCQYRKLFPDGPLGNRDLKQHDAVMRRRRSLTKFLFK